MNNQSRANRVANGGDVAQRLNATENSIKSLRAALDGFVSRNDTIAGQIARLNEQTDATEKAVTQLRSVQHEQTTSAATDPNLLNSLQQRIATLEQSIDDTNAEITKLAASEKTIQLAFSANALRAAVMSGTPYQDEFKQAKSLFKDNKILAPLEPFAGSGIVSEATLAGELRNLIPTIKEFIRTEAPPTNFLQRLQVNFNNLVRITPLNVPPSDNVSDVLVRLDNAAAHSDIGAALSELMKLPEQARAPAQAWIKKAEAHQMALAAAQLLATKSTRRFVPE